MATPLGSVSEEKPNWISFFSAWPPMCQLPALLCTIQQQGERGPDGGSPNESKGRERQYESRWIWTAIKLVLSSLLPPLCILITQFKIISSTLGGNLLVCEYLIWHWLCLYLQPYYHGEILGFLRKRRGDEIGCNMLEPGKKYWIELTDSHILSFLAEGH